MATDELYHSLVEKINSSERLLTICETLPAVRGQGKLQKKIKAELRFLYGLRRHPEKLKEEHLRSSNLGHLLAIVNCCLEMTGVVKILESFSYLEKKAETVEELSLPQKRIVIDVVADHGKTWIKVVARNPEALLQSSLGAGKFGRRSITEQVKDIILCASQNVHMYVKPQIKVWFATGVTYDLKTLLEAMDVDVVCNLNVNSEKPEKLSPVFQITGEICSQVSKDTSDSSSFKSSEMLQGFELKTDLKAQKMNDAVSCCDVCMICFQSESHSNCACAQNLDIDLYSIPSCAVLNLDVSTMIAYVSNLTNGKCNFAFQEAILNDQAKRERNHPVKNILDKLFQGHKLVCCHTAHSDFMEILQTVGGENEKMRASKLFSKISIVPDNPSEKALSLQTNKKVRSRSKVIFGTGDSLEMVTVTANLGFLRASQSQGIKFVAFIHESRALTELKESTAIPEAS